MRSNTLTIKKQDCTRYGAIGSDCIYVNAGTMRERLYAVPSPLMTQKEAERLISKYRYLQGLELTFRSMPFSVMRLDKRSFQRGCVVDIVLYSLANASVLKLELVSFLSEWTDQ